MMQILIGVGSISHAEIAVRLGAYIVEATGGVPTLLCVHSPRTGQGRAEQILAWAARLLSAEPANVATKIRMGQPAAEIVREAREGSYDLVVLGERPGRNLMARILGSTVEQVVARAPCPVLIARRAIPPRRILVCEGGRQPSLLQRLATQLNPLLAGIDQIVVLHVMSQMAAAPGVPGWELRAGAEEHMRQHTPEGELLLEDLASLARSGLHPQAKIRHGLVVDEIISEARDGHYDLVVIGAHQEEGWQHFLLDDLAHEIILHTQQPLLVVV